MGISIIGGLVGFEVMYLEFPLAISSSTSNLSMTSPSPHDWPHTSSYAYRDPQYYQYAPYFSME